MNEQYVPTTEQVRTVWATEGKAVPAAKSYRKAEGGAEFDRWLAEHDRELSERVWNEGHRAGWMNGQGGPYGTWGPEDEISNPHCVEKGADQ